MIYLDNAATTGRKPPSVVRAVTVALGRYSANPGRSGHRASEEAATAVFRARETVAKFFGSEGAETVVFTQNCTHSINAVLKGVLKRGDHVIVSSLEHNAVMRPLVKWGVDYDIAAVSNDDGETVENFRKLICPNTRMIFCTGASNVLGTVLPIHELGMLCREQGLLFGVDAAQTAGVLPMDMQKDGIDYLCIAPHKGLYAPMGIGVLIARKPIENTLIEGGTGTNSASMEQPDSLPERLESGTVNLPAILGTETGIRFVENRGIETVYRHEITLTKALYEGLSRLPQAVLYTPAPELYRAAPVLSFNLADFSASEVADYLSRNGVAVRAGLHCAPSAHRVIGTLSGGTVRVAPSVFNQPYEIERVIGLLKRMKKNEKNEFFY